MNRICRSHRDTHTIYRPWYQTLSCLVFVLAWLMFPHTQGTASSTIASETSALTLPGSVTGRLLPSLVDDDDDDDHDKGKKKGHDDDDDDDDDDDHDKGKKNGHGDDDDDEHDSGDSGVTYYVRRSGSDSNDGLTPETAFATIQKAVNCCTGPGYTIYVGPGTYHESVDVGYDDGKAAKDGAQGRMNRIIGDRGGTKTGDSAGDVVVDGDGSRNWGIMVYERDYWSIHTMTVKGCRSYGIYCGLGRGQEVHGCTVHVDGYYGILSVYGEDAQICNNRLYRGTGGYYMIYAYASGGTVLVDSNRFNETGDAYLSCGYGDGSWSQKGYRNSYSYYGILAYCYPKEDTKLVVTNNIGSDVLYGIFAYSYKKNKSDVTIAHNVMSGCYYGMYTYCYDGAMLLADNVVTDSYVGLMSQDHKGSTRIRGLLTNNITFKPVWLRGKKSIEGHIDGQDPMWVDASSGNFLPQPGSPLIDNGLGSAGITVDIRDLSRPIDGDGDNLAACDLGAYEYDPESDGSGAAPVIVMWREVESQ